MRRIIKFKGKLKNVIIEIILAVVVFIAATIEVESPYHAPRMDVLVAESVSAAESIFITFFD